MGKGKHSEAQIIAALKQVEAPGPELIPHIGVIAPVPPDGCAFACPSEQGRGRLRLAGLIPQVVLKDAVVTFK